MKSNKTMVLVLIVSLATVFILIGIAMDEAHSENILPDTALDNLFGTPPCSLPCWQGITPGITTSDDALQKLDNSALVSENTLGSDGSISGFGGADWYWKINNVLPDEQGNITWSNGVVQIMELTTFPYVSIGDAINRFGPPEKIDVIDCTDIPEGKYRYWCVTLYYAINGIEIHFTCEESWTEAGAQIAPSDQIEFVRLFKPSTIEEWLSSFGLDPQSYNLQDWKGYGNLLDLYIIE
ncbi:MAG: hypothetical protein HY864_09020 [Chloroflexi bacterium]|nr:hypothetical protein [Chloroflexota bacterium]